MSKFANQIVEWQRREGRHGLPWQQTRDPYRVWVSEIMLQQTQVTTVIPYYERFMASFPTVAALAQAPDDLVMQHWAGLGYYARARNLHKAAKIVVDQHGGEFPRTFEDILALPGIGRSTAAAISAFSFGEIRPILDGNVKRVFARHFGVEGDVKTKPVEEVLWDIADRALPKAGIEAYTQGLMDLGATVCARTAPACLLCPVSKTCVAFKTGRIDELPARGAKRETPHRQTRMLVLVASGDVLLQKRPPTGIWGGLWSFPELPIEEDPMKALHARFGFKGRTVGELTPVQHGFTHYSLTIYPTEIAVSSRRSGKDDPDLLWIARDEAHHAAVPAPVKKILRMLAR
jgi:A/G-specific adenine glycosylase